SLFACETDNLLFAGRCLSASRIAFSSLRVQQSLATTGQADGSAAALCLERDCRPHDLGDPGPLQQRLLRDDAWLPGVEADDLARDAHGAVARASSEAALRLEPGVDGCDLAARPAALVPVTAGRIERVALFIDNQEAQAEVRLAVQAARDLWDLAALDAEPLAVAFAVAEHGSGWTEFALDRDLPPGPYWLCAEGPDEVLWRFAEENAPGCCAAHLRPDGTCWFAGGGWSGWQCLALRIEPESRPFAAAQAINGYARPGAGANLWVSDPAQALPQWLEVELPQRTRFDAALLIFDTNLNRTNMATPGLFRAPECVRDYVLAAEIDGAWQELARVTDNYHRRREHRFVPVVARRVRLTVTATNGDPSARVYALRLYDDGRQAEEGPAHGY
ncbi:MAG: FAD-dependent oxidoreductase, partial [Armatimonadota bacterium]